MSQSSGSQQLAPRAAFASDTAAAYAVATRIFYEDMAHGTILAEGTELDMLARNQEWYRDDNHYIFGADRLAMIEYSPSDRKTELEAYRADLQRFIAVNQGSNRVDILMEEIREVSKYHPDNAYVIDSLSTEQLEHQLRGHITKIRKERAERGYLLEDAKYEFIELAKSAIRYGELPISIEQLEHRLIGLRYDFSDPLLSDMDGEYFADTHSIEIKAGFSDAQLRKFMFHELFHALSGRTREVANVQTVQEIHVATVGLMQYRFNRDPDIKYPTREQIAVLGQGRWLNEAITERLAMKFAEANKGTYPLERFVLDLFEMYDSNTYQLMLETYFNPMTVEHGDHRIARARLIHRLEDVYGPLVLEEIELAIKNKDHRRVRDIVVNKVLTKSALVDYEPEEVLVK